MPVLFVQGSVASLDMPNKILQLELLHQATSASDFLLICLFALGR